MVTEWTPVGTALHARAIEMHGWMMAQERSAAKKLAAMAHPSQIVKGGSRYRRR